MARCYRRGVDRQAGRSGLAWKRRKPGRSHMPSGGRAARDEPVQIDSRPFFGHTQPSRRERLFLPDCLEKLGSSASINQQRCNHLHSIANDYYLWRPKSELILRACASGEFSTVSPHSGHFYGEAGTFRIGESSHSPAITMAEFRSGAAQTARPRRPTPRCSPLRERLPRPDARADAFTADFGGSRSSRH
jgi:hypothetical protein